MLRIKIISLLSYIRTIGLTATIAYITQRFIIRKKMIVLSIPGIKKEIYLRRNSTDINVFQQIFIKRDLAFLKEKDYKICVDAGANIGLSTIYIKNLFPSAKVFSIEPEPSNVKMLRLNTRGYSNVTIIDKALSEDGHDLYLFDPGVGSDAFQTKKQLGNNNGAFKISSINMQELKRYYKIEILDFVKIDIEGAEEFCVNETSMEWIKQSKLLAIEIHEHLAPGCTKKIKDLLQVHFKFSQCGEYSIFENLNGKL